MHASTNRTCDHQYFVSFNVTSFRYIQCIIIGMQLVLYVPQSIKTSENHNYVLASFKNDESVSLVIHYIMIASLQKYF